MTTSYERIPADVSENGSEMTFFQHDWGDDGSIAVEIAVTIAELTGRPPESLESLHDIVDTDSLETIFNPRTEDTPRNNTHLQFAYEGFDITVYGNGFVIVRRLK